MGARYSWGLRSAAWFREFGEVGGGGPNTRPDALSGEERRSQRGGEADVCAVHRGREEGLSDGTVRSDPREGLGPSGG